MGRFKPGVTFSDFVVTGFSKSRMKKLDVKPPRDFRRGVVVWVGCLMGLLFLWIRLFSLQVIGHERYKALSDENRLRLLILPAMRGEILDRTGRILVSSEKIYKDESGLKFEGFRRIYPENDAAAHHFVLPA